MRSVRFGGDRETETEILFYVGFTVPSLGRRVAAADAADAGTVAGVVEKCDVCDASRGGSA